MPYLGILGLQFNKNYYHVFNQHTRICETIKLHPTHTHTHTRTHIHTHTHTHIHTHTHTHKLGTKNALFGSLDGILKNYCNISYRRPPNCLIGKIRAKVRIFVFGNKKCLI